MLAGLLTDTITSTYKQEYTFAIQLMMSIILLAGVAAIALYYYVTNTTLKDPAFQLTDSAKPAKKEKTKMSIIEGVKFLFRSPYLGLIALLVICYGICINLCEVLWKEMILKMYQAQLALDPLFRDLPKKEFDDAVKAAYNGYMGQYFFWTGLFTVLAIIVGSSILRRFGWKITALATPILTGVSAAAFFIFVIWKDDIGAAFGMTSVTILTAAVMAGLIQNLLSKPTKYAMFDPTKEMAYIPLDAESKAKGKAAVDVVGARLGKSGGAAIGQVLTAIVGTSALGYAPEAFGLVVVFVLIWLGSVGRLSTRFKALTGEK
jgi:AAA family ATP:ADP antiporter